MVPTHSDSIASDEGEAPESFSLAQSRQHSKKQEDLLRQIQAAEKEKKRTRNREQDRRLKEQAENRKKKRRAGASNADVEERMEIAMQEVEAEMSNGMDDSSEEFTGINIGSNTESEKESGDEDDLEKSSDEEPWTASKTNPNHLPDYLFTSAFSSHAGKPLATQQAKKNEQRRPTRKRVRSTPQPKDLLIGYAILALL